MIEWNKPVTLRSVDRVFVCAAIGLLIGFIVASSWNPLPLGPGVYVVPAPYRVSKIPGGTALRLAMVHDVLHERYLRHGAAWYTQRNADARKIISREKLGQNVPPSVDYLDALDDLAVGLEETGQAEDAITVVQQKLALVSPLPALPATRPIFNAQTAVDERAIDQLDLEKILAAKSLSPLDHHRYTAFANLGTILILNALPKVFTGHTDAGVQGQIRQSLDYIERAIAINPGGHFGREVWQAILTEHLLTAFDHPEMLDQYDMIGERLDEFDGERQGYGRLFLIYSRGHPDLFEPELSVEKRLNMREYIDRVGINPEWAALVNPDYPRHMPFDEPTLAIVGMWTLGGGPNPHFALALGRIMENIGQNQIAWNAYERAVELQDHFWPDAAIRTKMVAICRRRQGAIATIEDPRHPAAWQDRMRATHSSELAFGLANQKAYQDFETSQIAAGVGLNDPDFYTPFNQTHPSIASSPGLVDDVVVTQLQARSLTDFLPCLVLGLGVGMAIGCVLPKKKAS